MFALKIGEEHLKEPEKLREAKIPRHHKFNVGSHLKRFSRVAIPNKHLPLDLCTKKQLKDFCKEFFFLYS